MAQVLISGIPVYLARSAIREIQERDLNARALLITWVRISCMVVSCQFIVWCCFSLCANLDGLAFLHVLLMKTHLVHTLQRHHFLRWTAGTSGCRSPNQKPYNADMLFCTFTFVMTAFDPISSGRTYQIDDLPQVAFAKCISTFLWHPGLVGSRAFLILSQ